MSNWIKCSDRLPESEVLVLAIHERGDFLITARIIEDDLHYFNDDFWVHSLDDITHWQPLPELPEGWEALKNDTNS